MRIAVARVMLARPMVQGPLVLHVAMAIRDAAGVHARPGAVAVADGRIVSAGRIDEVRRAIGRRADDEFDHGAALLLPAFVNAHAHLDLAALGPRAHGGSFARWASDVMRDRPRTADAVATAVVTGLQASHAAGVGWLGDIAGSEAAVLARLGADRSHSPDGVSWLECFGIGADAEAAADRAEARLLALREALAPDSAREALRIDLQPHAPYSAGLALYVRSARLGAPSTHLAETLEEARFVRDGDGPFAELLRSIGKWDDSIRGQQCSPVQSLAPALASSRWVLAHGNYLDDRDVDLLASWPGVSLAYCPIASEYFGHRDHRYRELLARGVNVCLGTDSVLCQPPSEPAPHGLLPQLRRLWTRDRTDPEKLLAMATVHGARALGLVRGAATLSVGAPARLSVLALDARVARDAQTDAWRAALSGDAPLRAVEAM